ncbi:Coenzyme PQQ synthesis protein B [uncultured Gammaproteobacteria bacterium]|jgi:pyrroloquinoline quinone biosynthesis protein B|uniref:pyrroloquinoline quinone biosynthesis protein PqqB n=1 Tax=thiotrophic endosymbiont of Bathymodiolus puteoserpentis (Logatchev) TaxID=343240 RepID=UPI0010B0A165|nr:pyrroloquinoline quinone biosynthesis protein PqqB [thiotrophic endosymbiont of Bathymodiolus puteoserpentis (Logatchev)]CAC9500720.1 Coenzyme PQQ synthesis protein B [uncultured Gammaproteobacteria bacterium]CAC9574263.1 Coenzyme PQQ synthesis protein B [uncultured Gammaproteobacteria bacterium]CAC9584791.1 Coenzyme PQQ synthesis protein B [uncultured Gammaproteobacteria bacterium]CAC9602586.1 Coenzyme PQQ synthesis protein B [uncultured Gammaproteobacteria bacterium]CAC9631198.1 Coenzyme 
MYIRILGSAAGGGFPQWNCNCPNCTGVRTSSIRTSARTQSSIAVSADNKSWVLFNTSPDILSQLQSFDKLQPHRTIRDTAIVAILYVDAQIDHTTGLLMLREGCPHHIYCTDMVYQDLTTAFPIFSMLEHWGGNTIHTIACDGQSSFNIEKIEQLSFTAIHLDSKAPPYSLHRHNPHIGDNIGVFIKDNHSGKSLFYAPGLNVISDEVKSFMHQADCVLIDGTVWRDDELVKLKISNKLASDMGHLPQSGKGGMIEVLSDPKLNNSRKILIHINNTNPILNEDSEERKILIKNNIEVAYDGMDIEL